jgi:SMI1/KNR4 family protein SUKH-1
VSQRPPSRISVNGLDLPASFAELISRQDTPEDWMLKEDRDAYGNFWQMDLELYTDLERITADTNDMPRHFKLSIRTPAEIAKGNALSALNPGFIPFITDFSQIVVFGRNAEGDEFCFDFRSDLRQPSIIFWDDYYWRRVAPSFESFLSLIKPLDWREYAERYDPSLLEEVDNRPPSS